MHSIGENSFSRATVTISVLLSVASTFETNRDKEEVKKGMGQLLLEDEKRKVGRQSGVIGPRNVTSFYVY